MTVELAVVSGRSKIIVTKRFDVALAHTGKMLVQFVVVIGALPISHGHAEGGDDVGCTALMRLPHDLSDVFLAVLDEGQDRHHGDASENAVIGQGAHGLVAGGGRSSARFQFAGQGVIGRSDGETDRGKHFADALKQIDIPQHQIAFGEDVYRKAELGDHFQRPAGEPDFGLDGHVRIVHGASANSPFHPLACQLLA